MDLHACSVHGRTSMTSNTVMDGTVMENLQDPGFLTPSMHIWLSEHAPDQYQIRRTFANFFINGHDFPVKHTGAVGADEILFSFFCHSNKILGLTCFQVKQGGPSRPALSWGLLCFFALLPQGGPGDGFEPPTSTNIAALYQLSHPGHTDGKTYL